MSEAVKNPDDGFDAVLKNVLGNFVVAKVKGKVSRMFQGTCIACKVETVPYRIVAACAARDAEPAGTVSWHCSPKEKEFALIGSRDAIVNRMIALRERK